MIYLCACGFGTDDLDWFEAHLSDAAAGDDHREHPPWWTWRISASAV